MKLLQVKLFVLLISSFMLISYARVIFVQDSGSQERGEQIAFLDLTVTDARPYGAYGKVTATLYGTDSSDTVSIPRDSNNNRIADGWRNDGVEYYDASDDDETGPGENPNDGDNFSVFTEYRGFIMEGSYDRLDPSKKDLLIDVNTTGSLTGIGDASNLPSEILPRPINANERLGYPTFFVNFKGTDVPGHRSQRVVKVLEDNVTEDSDYLGFTFYIGWPIPAWEPDEYIPNEVRDIYIYTFEIDVLYSSQSDRTEARKNVVGHEIGHAINLTHCNHSSCIMEATLPLDHGDNYDSDHATNFKGYKLRED